MSTIEDIFVKGKGSTGENLKKQVDVLKRS